MGLALLKLSSPPHLHPTAAPVPAHPHSGLPRPGGALLGLCRPPADPAGTEGSGPSCPAVLTSRLLLGRSSTETKARPAGTLGLNLSSSNGRLPPPSLPGIWAEWRCWSPAARSRRLGTGVGEPWGPQALENQPQLFCQTSRAGILRVAPVQSAAPCSPALLVPLASLQPVYL